MAAYRIYLLWVLVFSNTLYSTASVEKRFSDFKRCADAECSMLLCRGKAVQDFYGIDCRFLSFKEGETIYVYYKLSGKETDVWAGSVGSRFGYFPKDLLAINHIYTDKEFEIPSEETDFVCFETGLDNFENYDIDSLLRASLSSSEKHRDKTGDQSPDINTVNGESSNIVTLIEGDENESDIPTVMDEQSLFAESERSSEPADLTPSDPSWSETDPWTETRLDPEIMEADAVDSEHGKTKDSVPDPKTEDLPHESLLKHQAEGFSDGRAIPEFQTTLGTTFDAVTSDDEETEKVTLHEEEEVDHPSHAESDFPREVPILSLPDESSVLEQEDTFPSEQTEEEDSHLDTHQDEDASEDKNMWTSLGDKVFAIVSGGPRTDQVPNSEEEDEDEEKMVSETTVRNPSDTQQGFEERQGHPETRESHEVSPEDLKQLNSVMSDRPDTTSLFHIDEQSSTEKTEDMLADSLIIPTTENPADLKTESERNTKESEDKDVVKTPNEESSKKLLLKYKEMQKDKLTTYSEQKETKFRRFREHIIDLKKDATYDSPGVNEAPNLSEEPGLEQEPGPEEEPALEGEPGPEEEPALEEEPGPEEEPALEEEPGPEEEPALEEEPGPEEEPALEEEPGPEEEPALEEEPGPEEEPALEEEGGELLEDENAVLSTTNMEPTEIQGVDEHEKVESMNLKPEIASEHLDFSQYNTEVTVKPDEPEMYDDADLDQIGTPLTEEEPEYSDSVLRLTLLREHFKEEDMERYQKFLGLKNLFKVEALFSDLEEELKAVRLSQSDNNEDIERVLEGILEASEMPILDEIEKMLDSRDNNAALQQRDPSLFDEEASILDDFQELAFTLRQKYSAVSDSVPMGKEREPSSAPDITDAIEEEEHIPNSAEDSGNLTLLENQQQNVSEEWNHDQDSDSADIEEDGGYFNRNKDNQPDLKDAEHIQVPQPILDNAFEIGLGVETEHPSSGSLESTSASHFNEEGPPTSEPADAYMHSVIHLLTVLFQNWGKIVDLMISKLPEEWSPGPSCMGLPWLPVVTTVFLGCFTTLCFIWKNILTVRPTEYLVGEKDIQKLLDEATREKTAVLTKMEELKTQSEDLRNQQQMSKESAESALERVKQLEIALKEVESRNELLVEECDSIMRTFDDERAKYLAHVDKSANYEKNLSKLQRSMKKTQDALAKSKALMDESKIREDARNSLHQSLQREHGALKEENNSLKNTAKQLEDKNHQLCDQIKVFIKSQKEYEDTIAQKDHSNEVLTELLVDLEAYDLQKSDTKAVSNGEASSVSDRASCVKRRIKQLMDVSQVQTTLSVVAEERNRFQSKLQSEERDRKALEEKHRELEHNSTSLKSEKSLIENQLKILQQKYEIMTEMYQQKELSLQRRLTDEELERRDKELKLSQVDGKALEAEQEVKIYRQRIKEMEEEVKKTEKALKVQIAEQERKAHENWVAANTAERSLSQEKTLRRNLRERLAALSNQLNDLRAANSAHPAVRCGDSYGPSPVSGGAPSPPLMIEGPGRPLSAPIGRRIDPYGHRPPFEKHAVPNRPDPGPRTSSPTNMDDSSSRPQGPGSFLESPIRDPLLHGLPPPGPRLPPPPPFTHGYRPPPPSHLPPGIRQANGIEGMAGAEFRYRGPPNRHLGMMGPRLGPPPLGPPLGPLPMGPPPMGPPPMRLPSNMPHHPGPAFGGGPPGPFPPYHQDMRFPGPWDYGGPPQHLPPPQDPGAPQPSGGQDSVSQHAAGSDPARSAMSQP